jgi:hypothetical protein
MLSSNALLIKHMQVPNMILGVFFAFNLAYGNTLRALLDEVRGHGTVEIREFVFAIILLMFDLSCMRCKKV